MRRRRTRPRNESATRSSSPNCGRSSPACRSCSPSWLTAPFSARFHLLDQLGHDIYAASLVGTALAAAVFLTPAAYHRLATSSDRATRLRLAIRLTILGMALLAVSVAGAVFVVGRFVFESSAVGGAIAAGVGLTTLGLWFVLPLSRRG